MWGQQGRGLPLRPVWGDDVSKTIGMGAGRFLVDEDQVAEEEGADMTTFEAKLMMILLKDGPLTLDELRAHPDMPLDVSLHDLTHYLAKMDVNDLVHQRIEGHKLHRWYATPAGMYEMETLASEQKCRPKFTREGLKKSYEEIQAHIDTFLRKQHYPGAPRCDGCLYNVPPHEFACCVDCDGTTDTNWAPASSPSIR